MPNEKQLIDASVLDERDANIILALAEKRMNATEVSRAVFMHRNSVVYHIEKIKRITGLNPLDFYDLHRLLQMLKKEDVRLEEKQATSDKASEENKRWIPVTERLPQEFISVLVTIPSEHPLPKVKEAYLANGCWATKTAIFPMEGITHWMPMPEPAKEDGYDG